MFDSIRSQIQQNQLKNAFLKTMDNNTGNDLAAHREINRLASGMTDSEILSAFSSAKSHAREENSKKNGIFDRNDPYQNVDSLSANLGGASALNANDWMNLFPAVPQGIWGLLAGLQRF